MVTKHTNSITRSIVYIGLATALILMIPLIAMQFSNDVDWNWLDFTIIGALLFGAGLTYELLARKTGNRVVVGIAVAAIVFLIWAELSVGIFGTPFAGS